MVRDNQEKLVGGIFGSMFYGCLHIDQIWVKPALQQQGIGRKLMQNAEEQARQIGCRIITVNTMTWEAKDFYKKLGFEVEFKRPGYDFDGEMIHLKKQL
jgi:ribosomal protein S18 acetylase RimI-like enzyme